MNLIDRYIQEEKDKNSEIEKEIIRKYEFMTVMVPHKGLFTQSTIYAISHASPDSSQRCKITSFYCFNGDHETYPEFMTIKQMLKRERIKYFEKDKVIYFNTEEAALKAMRNICMLLRKGYDLMWI